MIGDVEAEGVDDIGARLISRDGTEKVTTWMRRLLRLLM